MHRYRIHYRDEDDGCPIFTVILRAHDRQHAVERFFDTDDQAWTITKIERLKETT